MFCPLLQVLAPPKQKGVYPFFTFADLSLSDVIDNSALAQVDISTVGSGSSHGSRGYNADDSHSFDVDFSPDEDFLVVDCRTSTATTSLPPSGLVQRSSGTPATSLPPSGLVQRSSGTQATAHAFNSESANLNSATRRDTDGDSGT